MLPLAGIAVSKGAKKIFDFVKQPVVLLAIGIIVVLLVFKSKITQYLEKREAVKSTLSMDDNVVKSNVDGQEIEVNLRVISDGIYNAFYKRRLAEDEETAINLINSIPHKYVMQVAYLYSLKGKNMYDDFRKFLSKKQYAKVSSQLE